MRVDSRDDFSIFEGSEHMFYGLDEPYVIIREELEKIFEAQVPGTSVDAVVAYGEPKWLTLGRRLDDEPETVVVGSFGLCFRCHIDVATPKRREQLDAAMTMLFRDIDRPGSARMRVTLDLHDDAAAGFDDDVFQRRLLEFREEGGPGEA